MDSNENNGSGIGLGIAHVNSEDSVEEPRQRPRFQRSLHWLKTARMRNNPGAMRREKAATASPALRRAS
jgi:hypothetical protein